MDSKESHQESENEEVKGQSDREKQQQQEPDQQEEEQQFGVSEKIYPSGNKQSLLAKLEQAQQEIERLKQQQSMRSSKSQRDGQYKSLLAQMEQMRLENEQLKQQQSMRSSKSQRSIGNSQVSAAMTMDGLVPSSYQPPSDNPENMEHNTKNIPLYRQFYGVPIREIAPEEKVEEPVETPAKHHQVQEPTIKLEKYITERTFSYRSSNDKTVTIDESVLTNELPTIKQKIFGQLQDGTTVELEDILKKHQSDVSNDVITIAGHHSNTNSLIAASCGFYSSKIGKKVIRISGNNISDEMDLEKFLLTIGCQDFPYNSTNSGCYYQHLKENEENITIIIENIDNILLNVDTNTPLIQVTEIATIQTWINLLLARKLLPKSTLIVISKPASFASLDKSFRPKMIYMIEGLSDKNMETCMSKEGESLTTEVMKFIRSQNPEIQKLARYPIFLSSLIAKHQENREFFTSDPSIDEIYKIFLLQPTEDMSGNEKETSKQVDKFYFNLYKTKSTSFTLDDVHKANLTMEKMMQYSMLEFSYIDEGKTVVYRPNHQTLEDYRITRFITTNLNQVDEDLFHEIDDATWKNVQKLLCKVLFARNSKLVSANDKMGLLIGKLRTLEKNLDYRKQLSTCVFFVFIFLCCTILYSVSTNDMGGLMVKKLLKLLENNPDYRKNVIETYEKMKQEELCTRDKIREFPCWADMRENPMNGEQMELIADAIINYNDSETIEMMTSMKSWLGGNHLKIKLASKQECASNTKHSQIFSRFMEAMKKLTKKIQWVDIHNFNLYHKMEDLSNIIEKCGVWMHVHYDDDEEDEVVQQMDQRLQDVFSKLPRKGFPLIRTHHQYRRQFIKQLSPVMTSSYESMIFDDPDNSNWKLIQLPSVSCDDDLLRKLANHINGETFGFDFYISDRNEMINVINLIKHIKQEIWRIYIYFPRNTTRSETKLFANAIAEFNEKIWWIYIYNLTSNNIDDKDLMKIARKVDYELEVYFTDNQSDDVKSTLVEKFESLKPPRPRIYLHFRDDVRIIDWYD